MKLMTLEAMMAQASTLSDTEMKKALRFCNTRRYVTRDKTILLLSLHTGLRAKEIAALRIKDIYNEEGYVRSHFVLSAEQTKGARTRTVFVNKVLKQQLTDYAKWRYTDNATAPLFQSQRGGHFTANTMCQLFLNIYKSCGLSTASSHSGRRTFITRLANKGVGVRVLAELAGHSSISVTQRYIDVNDEQLAQAVELV
jgi:integrase/recombinase XerD